MAPTKSSKQLPFMNCIIKVNKLNSGWQKTVMKVLSDIRGVLNSTMDDKGNVTVSGKVDPHILVKRLSKSCKSAGLCWLQYGECSSNLYPPQRFSSSNSVSACKGFIDYGKPEKYVGNYYEGYGGDVNYISGPGNYYGGVNYLDRQTVPDICGRRSRCGTVLPSAPPVDWD